MDDLRKAVASLPPRTVVLYVSLLRDGAGRAFVARHAVSMLALESNRPGYGLSDTFVGHGVVGGRVISMEAQGRLVADLVGRVLAGESGRAMPPIARGAHADMFDWRQLRRWGLSESRLPQGSVVVNREPSIWERYGWYIVGGLVLIAAEAGLIAVLLAQRAWRKGAERSLADRLRFEMMLSELSVMFADLAPSDATRGIEGALRRIGEHLGIDRATLAEFSPETAPARVTHTWEAPGVPPVPPPGVDRGRFPWVASRMGRGEVVRFGRLAELPAEAAVDRASYAEFGVKSSLVIPLIAGDAVVGALGLSTVRTERKWPDDFVQRKQLVAGLFSSALVRMRGDAEVQRLRRDLTHVGRVTTMGELTASLAHELRQPLTAILTNAETAQALLASGRLDAAELGEILSDIVADDTRAGEVIGRLRSLLNKGEFERRPLDLNEVIREVVRLVQSDAIIRNVAIELELAEGLPPVSGDRVQLQQVILNLIVNALEAMSGESAADRRMAIATEAREDRRVEVRVRDRGAGIPAKDLPRILEPFYTTKPGGMRMGLSIARSIIEAHGGRLWAENTPEGGATFSLVLPVNGGGASVMASPATVYVVDDDPSVRKSLARLLIHAGYRVEAFASACEFLARPRRARPSCLVLDVRLPEMNGLDLQQALAATGEPMAIVFITAHGDVPMTARAMKAGAVDFLAKPYSRGDLLQAVERAAARDMREREERARVADVQARLRTLSPREAAVLALVVTGLLNKQIAAELGITEGTVKVHRGRVMEKMRVGSLAELVRLTDQIPLPPR